MTEETLAFSLQRLREELHRTNDEVEKLRSQAPPAWVLRALILAASGAVALLLGLHVRTSTLQETTVKKDEAAAMQLQILADARTFVAESETRMTKAISALPPEWLRELVAELKAGQADIAKRLTVVETKLEQR